MSFDDILERRKKKINTSTDSSKDIAPIKTSLGASSFDRILERRKNKDIAPISASSSDTKTAWRKALDSTGVSSKSNYEELEGLDAFFHKAKLIGSDIIENVTDKDNWRNALDETGNQIQSGINGAADLTYKGLNYSTKVGDNLFYTLENGLIGFDNQLNRTIKKDIRNRENNTKNSLVSVYENKINKTEQDKKMIQTLNQDSSNIEKNKTSIGNIMDDFERLKQTTKENNQSEIQKNIESVENPVGKKVLELTSSIGQMLPGMIPGIGAVYMAGSSADSYRDEGIQRGMNEEEADKYGGIMGLIEGATEGVQLGKVGRVFSKISKNKLSKEIIKSSIKDYGLNIADNFVQEAITEPISEFVAKYTGGDEAADFDNIGNRMVESGIDGALIAIILDGATCGIASASNLQNKITKKEKISQTELQKTLIDIQNSGEVDVENVIKEKIQNVINSEQNIIHSNSEKLELKNQNYIYEQSDNTYENVVRESASKIMNNTNESRSFVDLVSKIAKDRNTIYKFTTTSELKKMGFNIKDTTINGLINSNSEVLINLNSKKALNTILGHETTHLLEGTTEYKALQQIAIDYAKAKGEYDVRIQTLESLYKGQSANIDNELTSDIVGDYLFTDEKFITELTTKQPTLIQKIIEEVKHLYKMATTGSKEARDLLNLQHNLEKAYKSAYSQNNNQTSENARYSIQQDEKSNKYVHVDTDQHIFDGLNTQEEAKEWQDRIDNLNKETAKYSLSKEAYEGRQHYVDRKNANNRENATKVTDEQLDTIEMLTKMRHNIHASDSLYNMESSNYQEQMDFLDNINNELEEKGLPVINWSVDLDSLANSEDITYGLADNETDNKELFKTQKEQINTDIENYLEQFDKNHNTAYKPTGATRYSLSEAEIKDNDIAPIDKTKKSLSKNNEEDLAPIGKYNIYGKDLEIKEVIAPLKEEIKELKEKINSVTRENKTTTDRISSEENNNNLKQNITLNEENKNKITTKNVREKIIKDWGITEEMLSNGNDISSANFQITDPVRVNEKVFGPKLGRQINELTIYSTKHNTAEKIRFLNKERQDIKNLGIKPRSKESAAVQKYGEKCFIGKDGQKRTYGDFELALEIKDFKMQDKIKNAAKILRNKYDTYIDKINDVIVPLGYSEIPKRNDYMKHFQELSDVFSKTGVPFNLNDIKSEDLPTDINGLTEFNKPGKNWFASSQQRYGEKTTYDAITGIDQYLEGAGNLIFHTQDIQNYRALSTMIRDTFGMQKGFDKLEGLSESQIKKRIKEIQENKLTKYVAWLDEQANSLAGKKGSIDRGVERIFGRKVYTFFNTLKSQVGSNMTGFNVRSALTNFISSTIALGKTEKIPYAKGIASTIDNIFQKDNLIDKSDFLTARFGSESLSAKTWQKVSNAGQIFMTGSDYFTSNLIVRSKYFEGLKKGMSENSAIKYADDFAARVMGDRSQGATPELFNSKTLGLFTQFMLETANQWQYMIHDTKMDFYENSKKDGGLKAGAIMVFQLGQIAAYSNLYNKLFKMLTGSTAAFDPINILKILCGLDDESDDEETFEERMKRACEELASAIPFANLFGSDGRMPIGEALEPLNTTFDYITGGTDKYGNDIELSDVGKSFSESLPYLALPTGYGQAKKTLKGLSMYDEELPIAGSYNNKGDLKFTADDSTWGKIQAGLFGQYASDGAQEYIDSGFSNISSKNLNELQELGMDSTEYRKYKKGLSAAKTKADKYEYISKLDVSDKKKNIMLNNLEKDSLTDSHGYEKYTEENAYVYDSKGFVKCKISGSSTVYWYDSDNNKLYNSNYKVVTGVNKSKLERVTEDNTYWYDSKTKTIYDTKYNVVDNKNIKDLEKAVTDIDITEYNKYNSYEEFDFAYNNSEKYNVVKQICEYEDYSKYTTQISKIKNKYNNTTERKQAVFNYIDSLNLDAGQKTMLLKEGAGYSITDYKKQMYKYIDSLKITNEEKTKIWKELYD